MHDLIRDMGREIVRQESTLEPGRRSRLWFAEDIVHVLEENTGTDKVEFMKLEGYNNMQVQWDGKAFKEMKNLRILIIENTIFSTGPMHLPNSLRVLDWRCYPSPSLPSDFNPKRVVILLMPESFLQVFQPHEMWESLSVLNFEDCRFLTDLPSLREVPLLTYLCLDDCTNLVKIDDSIGFLEKLFYLSAKRCTKLTILAPCIMLISLEILDLQGYRFFEVNQDGEFSSEVSPRAVLICDHYFEEDDVIYLDVYYPYISPNNVIRVCSPNPLLHSDFHLLFKNIGRSKGRHSCYRKSSMQFSFQNKFPKIAVCCSILPGLKGLMLMIFKLSVFINGTKQFSSSCNHICKSWWNPELWCDLESKGEGIFSEQEWNEAEILLELGYPTPCSQSVGIELYNIGRGTLNWTLIGVYKEGNSKEDIEFKEPMSTFSFLNREPSLPSCLYYVCS
ncbi:hypothetical protein VNO78_33085 [Psophocarpus tetragonolobus]|uniref:Uncharacterized protein n=1 Tax=Psophocarpus tetragonolobus TaxID=3891 RepID=A0AAN9RPF9_PSOTE